MTMTKNEISGGVVHELPEDLRETLASDAEALAAWEDLTPLARNEWICWAISVKKPETRRQHVERDQRCQRKSASSLAIITVPKKISTLNGWLLTCVRQAPMCG